MINILLCHYNNYFNRIVKSLSSVQAYRDADTEGTTTHYIDIENVNFNPADGVSTKQVVGKGVGAFLDLNVDYAIVYESTTVENVTTETIVSRWFILDMNRTRGGQWDLSLQRDVLVDFNSNIMEAPCYVEKGMIGESSNPLLFNSEGMKFNEIKKDELLLKDETRSAWLVGYLKKDISEAIRVTYTPKDAFQNLVSIDSKDWYQCITYRNADGSTTPASKKYFNLNPDRSNFCWKIQVPGNSWPTYADAAVKLRFDLNGQNRGYSYDAFNGNYQGMSQEAMIIRAPSMWSMGIDSPICKQWSTEIIDRMLGQHQDLWVALKNDAISQVNTQGILTSTDVGDIMEYNGKYFEKSSKVYQLTIATGNDREEVVQYDGNSATANALWNSVLPDSKTFGNETFTLDVATANPDKPRAKFFFNGIEYAIIAQEVLLPGTIDFTLATESNRNQVEDAVYNMFAIPVNPSVLGITSEVIDPGVIPAPMYIADSGTTLGTVEMFSKDELNFATELCKVLGGNSNASKVYDLQILPYCPMNVPVGNNSYYQYLDLTNLTENQDYQWIENTDSDKKGIIFFPNKANFSKNIPLNILNESAYDEWQTIINPILKAQGTRDGLPLYTIGYNNDFMYKVEYSSVWDINADDDLIIEDGLTKEECEYLFMQISSGTNAPVISMTSTEFPTPPVGQEYTYTFTGDFTIKVKANWLIPDRPLEVKIKNECDFERLVSPNYNGMFQFKKSRLTEGLHYINVDCTYKPYTPYIKLNPDFSGLYGRDWNDSTGLICGGDFSIPMMNDAFTNYALQNKNYQEIFSRQIENLDVNQQIAKEQQQFQGIVSAVTAGIGGGASGAIAGAKAGPWGAAIGGVVGAAGGATAGIVGYEKDKDWLERQQGQARSYTVDNYNYQLGNIKAIPQSMTKSSPLSFNNKIWPILEFFSCTDEEKEVLKNKIKYDGMTVMAIGTLTDYMITGGFLKGKIIRLPNIREDFHIVDVIYQEVNKGFYQGE